VWFQNPTSEVVSTKDAALRIGVSLPTFARYRHQGVFVPHAKSLNNNRTNLYQLDCLEVRHSLMRSLINRGHTFEEIGGVFGKYFGTRDEELLSLVEQKAPSEIVELLGVKMAAELDS